MSRRYYTLAVRQGGPRWSPEFGDYDRELVEAEREDYRDHDVKARDLRILTTTPGQKAIVAAIAKLNGEG